jgi:hypothetical protein
MDQTERDDIQHEIEIAANKLFPGRIRRVELLQHGDAPMIEPGQLMPRLVFANPVGMHDPNTSLRNRREATRAFKLAVGPGLNQFRDKLLWRWPEIRYIELLFEDDSGRRVDGKVEFLDDYRTAAADGEFTHVMVRLKTAELDIVDTLIAAGIANNRAEAIRWALTRIRERPAYEQLREHTRDIERLTSEF